MGTRPAEYVSPEPLTPSRAVSRLVQTVQMVLESGRVADWNALVAQVPTDRLRQAIHAASLSHAVRLLAYRLLDREDREAREDRQTPPSRAVSEALSPSAPAVCEE